MWVVFVCVVYLNMGGGVGPLKLSTAGAQELLRCLRGVWHRLAFLIWSRNCRCGSWKGSQDCRPILQLSFGGN